MEPSLFRDQGFAGPGRVMTISETRQVAAALAMPAPAPLDWPKSAAVSSRLLFDVATRPSILRPVTEVLGRDVVLWGASVVTSPPGHLHRHHVDIETSHPAARGVSVWIGLQNATRASSLRLVARSHRFGVPLQQVAFEKGRRRGEYGEDEVLAWSAEFDPGSSLVTLDVSDGEAIWFDGRLWHGSLNETPLVRQALLLQYASADTAIRIPDFSTLEWPLLFFDVPRPPCIVVSGEASEAVNRLAPIPVAAGGGGAPVITNWVKRLDLPLAPDPTTGFRPHHLFRGITANTSLLTCHVSTLHPGGSPHEPHVHDEEELLMVLTGEADVTYDAAAGRTTRRVAPGSVAYYPAGRAHTIRATGAEPAEYLMLKWIGPHAEAATPLDSAVYSYLDLHPVGDAGFRVAGVFEGATRYFSHLHSHLTELESGSGYEPHVDAHDLVIVLLEGKVTTLGTTVAAPAVVFTSGGTAHGLRAVGGSPARYLVFEFHGNTPDPILPEPETAAIEPASSRAEPAPSIGTPRPRRLGVTIWTAGGRVVRRYPRLHRRLRRMLRRVSPWD